MLSTSNHNNLDQKVSFLQDLEWITVDSLLYIVCTFMCWLDAIVVTVSCGQHRKGKKDSTKSCPTLAIPRTVACQALLSMDSPGKNTGVGCRFLLQGSSQPRNWPQVYHTVGICFPDWAAQDSVSCSQRATENTEREAEIITEVLILIYVLTFGFCQTKLCLYNVSSDLLHFQLFPLKLVFVAWSKKGIINGRTLFSDSS